MLFLLSFPDNNFFLPLPHYLPILSKSVDLWWWKWLYRMQRNICSSIVAIDFWERETELTKLELRVQWKIPFLHLNLRSHSAHSVWLYTDRIQVPHYRAERGPSVFNLALAGAAVIQLPLRRVFKSRDEAGGWKKGPSWISLLPGPIIHPLF